MERLSPISMRRDWFKSLDFSDVQTISVDLASGTPATLSVAPVSADGEEAIGYAVVVVSAQAQAAAEAALTRTGIVATTVFAVLVLLVLLGIQKDGRRSRDAPARRR